MDPETTKTVQDGDETEASAGFVADFISEITSSPLNLCLLLAIVFLIYKILKGRNDDTRDFQPPPPPPPKMKKRDFTIAELLKYDGTDSSGRVLIAVNGKVFDCTRGKRFYGPGGAYASFAGHDASRALAMFQTDLVKDEHDDLSDLTGVQMESVREWEVQLAEKYDFVGKLLKPGEEPSNYSDEEEGGDEDGKDSSTSATVSESTSPATKKNE